MRDFLSLRGDFMTDSQLLTEPPTGAHYHLVKGNWDEDSPYLQAIAPAPITLKFPGYESKFDQFKSREKLFSRNKTRGISSVRGYFYFWLEFINNFALSLVKSVEYVLNEDLSRLYAEIRQPAFKDFINFNGELAGACFCVCPDSDVYRHPAGSQKGQIAYRADFPCTESFGNPDNFTRLEKLCYPITAQNAQVIKTTPYDELVRVFDGLENVDTQSIARFGFINPFAGIIQGTVSTDTFFNARRCLRDEKFIALLENIKDKLELPICFNEKLPLEIKALFERGSFQGLRPSERDTLKQFVNDLPLKNKAEKIEYVHKVAPHYSGKEISTLVFVTEKHVSKTLKRLRGG
jgi:hypothetical protein